MKKILTIKFNDLIRNFSYIILDGLDDLELVLDVNDILDDDKTKKSIEKNIIEHIEYLKEMEGITESNKEISLLQQHLNKKINIFDGIEYIYLEGNISNVKHFLDNNNQLKQEKIVLFLTHNYDIEELKEIEKTFKEWDNIYIAISLYEEPVKLEEYIKSAIYINRFMMDIKNLKLSPLEEMMFIYSTISGKTITPENSTTRGNEIISDKLSSKEICNLYEDLLNKFEYRYIACDGYINNNFYNKVCYGIYIDDSKYGVDGIYYFSPLLETLLNNTSNESFRFFAQTPYTFENNNLLNIKLETKLDGKVIDQFLKSVSTGGLISIGINMYSNINKISNLILGEEIIPPEYKSKERYEIIPDFIKRKIDINEIVRDVESFKDKLTTPIDQSVLLYLLDNILDIYDEKLGTKTDYFVFVDIALNSNWDIFKTGDIERKKVFYKQYIESAFKNNLNEDDSNN